MPEIESVEDAAPFPCTRCGKTDRCLLYRIAVSPAKTADITWCHACQIIAKRLDHRHAGEKLLLEDRQQQEWIDFLAERPQAKGQSDGNAHRSPDEAGE